MPAHKENAYKETDYIFLTKDYGGNTVKYRPSRNWQVLTSKLSMDVYRRQLKSLRSSRWLNSKVPSKYILSVPNRCG